MKSVLTIIIVWVTFSSFSFEGVISGSGFYNGSAYTFEYCISESNVLLTMHLNGDTINTLIQKNEESAYLFYTGKENTDKRYFQIRKDSTKNEPLLFLDLEKSTVINGVNSQKYSIASKKGTFQVSVSGNELIVNLEWVHAILGNSEIFALLNVKELTGFPMFIEQKNASGNVIYSCKVEHINLKKINSSSFKLPSGYSAFKLAIE